MPWRIIAVDNASTDATAGLLQEATRRLPLTVLHCPDPGKMPALKSGAASVTGDFVLFTDDDVEPDSHWLQAYEAAANSFPQSSLFGGPIVPTPMEPVTPWFQASVAHHAELFAFSDEPDGPVDAPAHIYGPNFFVHRKHIDVLADVAGGLGPTFTRGKKLSFAMGEDTMIMELLSARGANPRYVRRASVNHLVRTFQTEPLFMLERATRHGRGSAIRFVEAKQRSVLRRLATVARNVPRALKSGRLDGMPASAETFNALWDIHWARGAVLGAAIGP